jgi:hypothetical protein
MKKRNILIAAVLVIAMGVLPACDVIQECGLCKLVTEDAVGNKTYGPELPFCGDDLKDKEDALPVTINGVTTYWICD